MYGSTYVLYGSMGAPVDIKTREISMRTPYKFRRPFVSWCVTGYRIQLLYLYESTEVRGTEYSTMLPETLPTQLQTLLTVI